MSLHAKPERDSTSMPEGFTDANRRIAFATITVAFVMEVMDSTIVNVAIPSIQADLHAGGLAVQWLTAGYFLSLALFLVTGGRLGDRYGYRRVFAAGIAAFTIASLLCGLAQSPAQLVLARISQGIAASVMVPQVTAILQILYRPVERVRALAVFGVLGGAASVLGPVLGGTLIEIAPPDVGWRLIFLVNVPVGMIGITMALKFLPNNRSPHLVHLDPVGTLLLASALAALLFPLIQGREYGWPWWSFVLLALSAPLIVLLVRHSRKRIARVGSALLMPDLLRDRCFAAGLSIGLLFAAATGGFFLVFTVALQGGLGYSPLQVAMLHIPFALGVTAGISGISRSALPRLGRMVPMLGSCVFALAMLGLPWIVPMAAPALSLSVMGLAGFGMGMTIGPSAPITLARIDPAYAGFAGGMLKAAQQIGGAVGVALIGSVYFALLEEKADVLTALRIALAGSVTLSLAVLVISFALPQDIFDGD